MLGPRELSKEGLEVLSEISAMLLLPDMIRMLENGTTEQIRQFISNELAGFFLKIKWKWRGLSSEYFIEGQSQAECQSTGQI